MRYVGWFVLGAVLMLGVSTARAGQPIQVEKGIKVGMSLANTSGDDLSDLLNAFYDTSLSKGSHFGVSGGFFMSFLLSPAFALQPELLFTQKGIDIDGPEGSGHFAVNYIEVPVMAKYLIPSTSIVKPAIYGGPVVSIKAGSSVTAKATDPADSGIAAEIKAGLEDLADNDLNGLDLGLAFGASMNINTVVLDTRYNLGLTNIVDVPDASDVSVKNGAFHFYAGVLF
jgi:hypothetical protein